MTDSAHEFDDDVEPSAEYDGFDVAGSRIGEFELLRRLPAGGMAEVFVARKVGIEGFEKVVALKRILPHLARNRRFVDMFLDEARLAAKLNHPNIVSVLDIGRTGEDYFFTMEFLHGENLHRLLSRSVRSGRGMSLDQILWIGSGACLGLHYAHELSSPDNAPLQIVHRDVSPTNVIVTYDGAVKVLDFGVAKAASHTQITKTGVTKGKASYMSPEQCLGQSLDRRSDVFCLGILLWEMVTQKRLFRGENDLMVMNEIASKDAPPPSTVRTGIPKELEAIIMLALNRDREARYPTARDLERDLSRFAKIYNYAGSASSMAEHMRKLFGRRRHPWRKPKVIVTKPEIPVLAARSMLEAGLGTASVATPRAPTPRVATRRAPTPRVPTPPSFAPPFFAPPSLTPPPRVPPAASSYRPLPAPAPGTLPEAAALVGPSVSHATPPSGMSSITRVRRQGLTVALSVSIVVLVGLSVVVGYFLATRSGGDGPAPDPGDNVAVAGSVAAEAAEAVPESNCPPDMTFIRGGSFLMGLDDLESPTSRPPHPVDVSGFCIETREVTDAAFRGCSDIGECKRSFSEPREPDGEPPVAALAELCNARKPGRETHPANCVTWDQARQYCTWKDRVLPSEAQWEFATRGAEGRRHPWGDEKPGEDRVNACGAECRSWRARHGLPTRGSLHLADDGHAATAPVGSFGEGATPEGVQDLAGNVAEWTADRFEPYRGGTSPKGVPPANRVVRGGGFGSERASQVTGFVRDVRNEDGTYVDVGFRCVAKAPS